MLARVGERMTEKELLAMVAEVVFFLDALASLRSHVARITSESMWITSESKGIPRLSIDIF